MPMSNREFKRWVADVAAGMGISYADARKVVAEMPEHPGTLPPRPGQRLDPPDKPVSLQDIREAGARPTW